ncbi:MAG: hypothetical protein DKINENOH_02536 [bacterium]|nr:hypothetical protein [bacterium]
MIRIHLFAWVLSFTLLATLPLQARRRDFPVDPQKKPLAISGFSGTASPYPGVKPHTGNNTGALGPGMYLMTSFHDYGSNGGVLPNIVNYGDAIAVGRMAARWPDTADLGTYWNYFDGIAWWPQMEKVPSFYGKAWSNLSALADGRSVVAVHSGEPNRSHEVTIDALQGFAIWTTGILNNNTGLPLLWPRLTVDGADKIIICSSVRGVLNGIAKSKEVTLFNEYDWRSTQQVLKPDTSLRTPQFSADDQAMDSFGNKTAIAVAERGGDIHLWETQNNGATWTYRNLTNYPNDLPIGAQEIRPWDTCDLIYDNTGKLHVFWEAVRATQDTAGTALELWHSREVGIQHWEEGGSIQQVVAWKDLPDAQLESDEDLFRAGDPFDQINADATLTMQPQAAFDGSNGLYLVFAAYRPLDFDTDSTHFTDIYVRTPTSGDVIGRVVNITDTPQSEDLWASVADNLTEAIHLVYQSDGNTGNSIIGGGAAPTVLLYYAVSPYDPIEPGASIIVFAPTTLEAEPGDTLAVPVSLRLNGESLSSFRAALEVTQHPLSFVKFAPGPLDPEGRLRVIPITPARVGMVFEKSQGLPIAGDGVLATLKFRVGPNPSPDTKIAELGFSETSATDMNAVTVPVRSLPGQVSILPQRGEIHGTVWHDLDGDGARDANEAGLAGWRVYLAGARQDSVPTDLSGSYSFRKLDPGGYSIAVKVLPGWSKTVPPGMHVLHLTLGQSAHDVDFGLWASDGGALGGTVWFDKNGNGLREPTEFPLLGRTIHLRGAASFRATTDADGRFVFPQVAAGQYSVSQELFGDWHQTWPPSAAGYVITLQPHQIFDTLDFGNALGPLSVGQASSADLPAAFALFSNMPNPFNPGTIIRYAVPRASRVRLEVFNLLGERVAMLIDGLQAAGYHTVEFRAADLPSGLYLCRLTAPGFRAVSRMLLLR